MINTPVLDEYANKVEGLLGAICAFKVNPSVASATVIREQAQSVESLRVNMRAEMVEFGKNTIFSK